LTLSSQLPDYEAKIIGIFEVDGHDQKIAGTEEWTDPFARFQPEADDAKCEPYTEMFPPDVPEYLRGLLRGELRKVFVREEFRRSGLFYAGTPLRYHARRFITRFGEGDISGSVVLYEPRTTPPVLHRNSNSSDRSVGFPTSGYEYLTSLEYESTDAEDSLFSDDDDSAGTGATTPTIESDFEEDVQDTQALKEHIARADDFLTTTRIEVRGIEQSTSPPDTVSITDLLADGELEKDDLQIDPSILGLISSSANEALPLNLLEDKAPSDHPALTLLEFGLDTWADEVTATLFPSDSAPQLPELVFDGPDDDWFEFDKNEEEGMERQVAPQLPELAFDEVPLCDFAAYEYDESPELALLDFLQSHSITDLLANTLKTVTKVGTCVQQQLFVTDNLQPHLSPSPSSSDLARHVGAPGPALSPSPDAIDIAPKASTDSPSPGATYHVTATLSPDRTTPGSHPLPTEPGGPVHSHDTTQKLSDHKRLRTMNPSNARPTPNRPTTSHSRVQTQHAPSTRSPSVDKHHTHTRPS
jgi:hypothetical protein